MHVCRMQKEKHERERECTELKKRLEEELSAHRALEFDLARQNERLASTETQLSSKVNVYFVHTV